MGQKINPVGFRLGIFRKWKNNWFLEKKKYSDFLHLNFEIVKYFNGVFRNNNTRTLIVDCLISKISFSKIYIFVLFYRLRRKKKRFKKKNKNSIGELRTAFVKTNLLTKYFKTRKRIHLINMALDFVRVPKIYNQAAKLKHILIYYKNRSQKITKNFYFLKLNRQKKIILRRKYISIKTIKKSLEILTNANICLLLINAVAFIKFYEQFTKKEQKDRNDYPYLERKLVKRYQSDVRLAKDTLYVLFIAVILKKAEFLAKFIGYQLKRMPKNRRQTKLLYYIRSLLRYALKVQLDIIGIRIQFTGRINGRPRSKTTSLNEGILPLQTQAANLEYGESFGITRYGTIGVKVWINYSSMYSLNVKNCFLKYLEYGLLKKNVTA